MKQLFIIVDDTIKYVNAQNPLDERLLYVDTDIWSRDFELAHKFTSAKSAIDIAKELHAILPVKIFAIESVPNGFNLSEVKL